MAEKHVFIKDFSKLFSGAALAQIIGFAISPILSRLYQPDDFGYFTLYLQMLLPLTVFGTLSLYLLLPRFRKQELKTVTFQVAMGMTFLVATLLVLGGVSSRSFSEGSLFHILWPWLFVGILLTNVRGFFHFVSISDKKLLLNSRAKVFEGLIGAGGNVGGGLAGLGFKGLILGNYLGQIIYLYQMIKRYRKELKGYIRIKTRESYLSFLLSHRKHIVIQSFNHLIEYALVLSFSILVTTVSSIDGLGYFAFYLKVVSTPFNFVSDYYSQAVLLRASDFSRSKDILNFFLKSSVLIFASALFAVVVVYFWAPDIFKFVFGDEWEESGLIAKSYVVGTASTFYIRSFQYIPNLRNRHEIYTIFSFLTYGIPVATLLLASHMGVPFLDSLTFLSALLFFLALAYFITLTSLLRRGEYRE